MVMASRRNEAVVEALLPLFAREITADPEHRDPRRRRARIEDFEQIRLGLRALRRQQRAAAERKKDDELRLKLNGDFLRLNGYYSCTY